MSSVSTNCNQLKPSCQLSCSAAFNCHSQVGNAAGTATCLVAGGGNEKPGVVVATPAGALATFTVSGLGQLKQVGVVRRV